MENQSIISSLFTEKELAELNFTNDEIEAIEEVEAAKQALAILPSTEKQMDAFFDRVAAECPAGKEFNETFNHYLELSKTDPKFISQIVSMSAIIDTVTPIEESKTEKISLDELNQEKNRQISNSQKEKFAAIDAVLKNMK